MTSRACNQLLDWVGMQLQMGGDDLPQWNAKEQLWYVRKINKSFGQFSMAVKAAMTGKITEYRDIACVQK